MSKYLVILVRFTKKHLNDKMQEANSRSYLLLQELGKYTEKALSSRTFNNVNFSLKYTFILAVCQYGTEVKPDTYMKCVMNKAVFIISEALSRALTGFFVPVVRGKRVSKRR